MQVVQRLQQVGQRRVEVQADGRPVEDSGHVAAKARGVARWGAAVPPHPTHEPLGHAPLPLDILEEVAVGNAQCLPAQPAAHRLGRPVLHRPVPEHRRQDVLPHSACHVPIRARLLLKSQHLRVDQIVQREPTSRLRPATIRTPTRGHPTLLAGGARVTHVRPRTREVLQRRHDAQVLERVIREHHRVPSTRHDVLLQRDVRCKPVHLVRPAHIHPLLVHHPRPREVPRRVQLLGVPVPLRQCRKVLRVHRNRVPHPELRATGRHDVTTKPLKERARSRELTRLHLDPRPADVSEHRRRISRQVVRVVDQDRVRIRNELLDLVSLHPATGILIAVLDDRASNLFRQDGVCSRGLVVVETTVLADDALLLQVVARPASNPQDLGLVSLKLARSLERIFVAVQLDLHLGPHPVNAVNQLLQSELLHVPVQLHNVAHQRAAFHVNDVNVDAGVQG